MMLRKNRAFSFTELILASVLTGILMIAGTATISMMYQAATNFHNIIQSNLNWYDFTNQISADMHRASYAEINDNTLTLYEYGGDIIATYTNFAEGVQYNPGGNNAQPIERFRGVNVGFTAAGWDDLSGRITEIRIDMVRPFVNVIYLRHGVSVEQGPTWALEMTYTGPGGTATPFLFATKQAFLPDGTPDGFVSAGDESSTGGAGQYFPHLIKLNPKGEYKWSRKYNLGGDFSDFRNGTVYDMQMTRDNNGAFNGYCMTGHLNRTAPSGAYSENAFFLSVDLNGSLSVFSMFGDADYEESYSVKQCFVSRPKPGSVPATDGYIIAGRSIKNYINNPPKVYVVKIANNGSISWARKYVLNKPDTFPNPNMTHGSVAFGVQQLFNDDGTRAGFILGCEHRVYPAPVNMDNYVSYPMLMKINTSGNIVAGWPKVYYETGGDNYWPVRAVDTWEDAAYKTKGYVLLGSGFAIRTDINGKVINPYGYAKVFYGGPYEMWPPSLSTSFSAQRTKDWGYLLCGVAESGGSNPNLIELLKISYSNGSVGINKVFGDAAAYDCIGTCAAEVTDANSAVVGYVVSGYTDPAPSRAIIIKTDADGNCPDILSARRTISYSPIDTFIGWPALKSSFTSPAHSMARENFTETIVQNVPESGN